MHVHDGIKSYDLPAEPRFAAVTHLAALARDAGDYDMFFALLPKVAEAEGLAGSPLASATEAGVPVEAPAAPPGPAPSLGCASCGDAEALLVEGECRPCRRKVGRR